MAKRALIEHRPWLLASIAASFAYYLVAGSELGEFWQILIKGGGVGFLAVYVWRRASGLDAMILTLALALSAAADMALVVAFEVGGALFAASHLTALVLYLRNRRDQLTISQGLLGIALLVASPVISYMLSERIEIAVYASTLGLMAAAAWTSRFPCYRVGIGAILFVVSDWLIFSRMGAFDLGVLPDYLVWPLYYAGQLMIATGVVQTLRGEKPAR
ncbi:lysoplasmalogenase family protein [Qipengyuania sp. ASV99]|uniref:lysoplasmalogenase family protein n=1 Tax=Qipengyuania sp. ASV99 TaxID=3399681 RepID=UPI003A4C583C